MSTWTTAELTCPLLTLYIMIISYDIKIKKHISIHFDLKTIILRLTFTRNYFYSVFGEIDF